jgi:dTDP-4-dehydrorhamnose 3,5-epimerase
MGNQLAAISLTPLKQIPHVHGDIYHALKCSEDSFVSFGEAYFSFVNEKHIKGWKKHTQMVLNLIVPIGKIKFVILDESLSEDRFKEIILGPTSTYARLTIPPGYWVAFEGLEERNCLLNIASMEHNPEEAINKPLEEYFYNWK